MESEDRLERLLSEWRKTRKPRDEGEGEAEPDFADPPEFDEDLLEAADELLGETSARQLREAMALLGDAGEIGPESSSAVPEAPERIGPYRIERVLGRGGMGVVHLATVAEAAAGLAVGERVALKLIHSHLLESPGFFKRFLREGEIGRAVRHDNVMRCHDADALVVQGRQVNFLVMEFVEGQTLRELLDELERVPEELCLHIAREVASGLGAIHAVGAVHRDLKPENVLLTPDHRVKIMDLGVARLADVAIRLSRTGMFVGSPCYASPEQIRIGDEIDGRADLHALGLILYELAAGAHPFAPVRIPEILDRILTAEPRRLGEVNPQLSPFFEEVTHKLLAKEREDRFPSATVLLRALTETDRSGWWQTRALTIRAETRQPLRRIRIQRETEVYGRGAELDLLEDRFELAMAGRGRVVLIEGEDGVGKSRLVDEFIRRRRADNEDLNFLFGRYTPGGAATATGAWATAFREHLGPEGLTEALAIHLDFTPTLVPAFAALLRGEPPVPGTPPLTKAAIQTAFVYLARALAEGRPTVILIDDLHLAPQEGRALFASLCFGVPRHRILLIGTMVSSGPESWFVELERGKHAERLELGRLAASDLVDLLEESFGSGKLARDLVDEIAARSGGNPLFAFEILRSLKAGPELRWSAERGWGKSRSFAGIELPDSVLDLVNERIASLTREEREILEAAACCGYEFDPILAGTVAGLNRMPALRLLAHIERTHRLIRATGRSYGFDHEQVQKALYRGLPDPLRFECHVSIAGEILRQSPEPDGKTAVSICHHLLSGARGDRALPFLDRAIDHLTRTYRNDRAVTLTRRALESDAPMSDEERVRLQLRRAHLNHRLARRSEEKAAILAARTLSETTGDAGLICEAHLLLGRYSWSIRDTDEALAAFVAAGKSCRAAKDRKREGRARAGLGRVYAWLGRGEEAEREFTAALDLAKAAGDRAGEANCLRQLSAAREQLGRYAQAAGGYERAIAICREINDRRGEAEGTRGLGHLLLGRGRHDEARPHFERAMVISRETGALATVAVIDLDLGSLAAAAGEYGRALDHVETAVSIAREVGDRFVEGRGYCWLGRLHSILGDQRTARHILGESRRLLRRIGADRDEGSAIAALAVVAGRQGKRERALRLAEEAVHRGEERGHQVTLGRSRLVLGTLLAAAGREEEAARELLAAVSPGVKAGSAGTELIGRCRLALLPGGDVAAAESAFSERGDLLGHDDRMTARYLLYRATGEEGHIAEAWRLLRHLRDHAPERYRRTVLESVPLHREIRDAAGV